MLNGGTMHIDVERVHSQDRRHSRDELKASLREFNASVKAAETRDLLPLI